MPYLVVNIIYNQSKKDTVFSSQGYIDKQCKKGYRIKINKDFR